MLHQIKKLKQLVHWGPFLALSVIFAISSVSIMCVLMWWPPLKSWGGFLNFAIFLMWNFLTLYNYFQAAMKGPGFVPEGWVPAKREDRKYLQYCELCEGYKSPRSHHCRKCDRCVMKMDHHCPWINTCCGHFNHANFVWFLFFAPIGCIHAAHILIPSMYRAINYHHYLYYGARDIPLVQLGIVGFISSMFGIGLAIGVIIAVGMLFCIQMKSILKNETGIETWIIEKALDRDRDEDEDDEEDYVYPYNLGWRRNFWEVITTTGKPKSDGFTWNVREDCHQYSFTIEQIKQKAQKRERTLEYAIVMDYCGSLIPITWGCRVCYGIPCTDEPRISIRKGDRVKVTRWKKHWMYGTKLLTAEEMQTKKRLRGWFPRKCGRELVMDDVNGEGPPDSKHIKRN